MSWDGESGRGIQREVGGEREKDREREKKMSKRKIEREEREMIKRWGRGKKER